MKAALPPDEDRRLRILSEWEILDTPPERAFDDLVQLAASITQCPIALVSLVDRDRQWFKSRLGLDACETSRDASFCAHALLNPADVLVIEDATKDPRTSDNPLVLGDPKIRFYAGAPLINDDGTALGTLCVIDRRPRTVSIEQLAQLRLLARLVTTELRLRNSNRELALAHREAMSANRSKSAFLAAMSHEIRTPLTGILGYTELLGDADLSPEDRSTAIETIARSGRHLLGLINDILDFSKIEAGQMSLDIAPCAPIEEIAEAISVVRHAAKLKGLRLTTTAPRDEPLFAWADALRLRQIVVNLVGNAVKFTHSGTVTVDIRVSESPGADNPHDAFPADAIPQPSQPAQHALTAPVSAGHVWLSVRVSDTGIGIDDAALARLFTPFTQADQGATRQFGGTGLGLSISRKLAELMGGTIRVSSRLGVGSTFVLRIPLELISAAEAASAAPVTGPWVPPASREFDPKVPAAPERWDTSVVPTIAKAPLAGRVLLAEDGEDNQRLLTAFLKGQVESVTVVESGLDVLTEVERLGEPFDLILMDLHMPGLDGLAATRRLRQSGYTGPIVALTASATVEDRDACVEAGCDAFLTKPITRPALRQAVAQWGKPRLPTKSTELVTPRAG